MLTLIIGSVIFLSALYMGFKIKNFYLERKKYYLDLNDFIVYYENEIKSYKLRLFDIIEGFTTFRKGIFSSDLKSFIENTKSGNGANFCFSKKLLCVSDKETVSNFFRNIGKCDLEGELNNIRNFRNRFSERTVTVQNNSEKEAALYMKLSVLTGLAVMIIVL